jgi:hypothetical protein
MGAEIRKIYKQDVPALRFIGKKYGDNDRVDGMFGKYWDEFFQNEWWALIAKHSDKDMKVLYEDGDAYIGLMRHKDNEPFEYWVGIFMPEGTLVPDGFTYHDFSKATLGVCWLHGSENEVFMQEKKCALKLMEAGHTIAKDIEGATWFFERTVHPRFTTPDEDGKIILDICFYV